MGWAGLVRPNRLGRTQPQKCWADFGPKMDWADLGPKNKILFWARPGPEYRAGPDSAQNAGLGQDPPGPDQNGRGEIISPHPCMQNAIRSACREGKTNKNQNRGEEELPGAEVVVALVLLLLLEAVLVLVLVLLEAEAVDSRTAAVALLLAAEREFLPPPLSFVSFPFCFLPFLLLLWFSFPPPFPFFRFTLLPLPFLSLSVFFPFSSPLLCSSRFFFSPSVHFSPSLLLCWLLFIEPSEWLFAVEHGEQPAGHWARLPTLGPPPRLSGRCAVGGRPLCSVGGLQARERGRQKFQKKAPFFPSSPLHVRGGRRKMNSVVQNDTVLPFSLFFFFFEWMKRRRFG